MYEFLDYRARDVMTTDLVTLGPERSLAEVEALFEQHAFNSLPVVTADGELLGIVSKLDLLRAFRFTDEHMFPPYDEIMKQSTETILNTEVEVIPPNTPLTRVLDKMLRTRNKSFPVVDRGRLVGMIAREDVMEALRRGTSGEAPPRGAE